MESFTITCENGSGEAYRSQRDAPWVVTLPACAFYKRATLSKIKSAIRRQAQKGMDGKVLSFGEVVSQ
jgi:hypothetical protein